VKVLFFTTLLLANSIIQAAPPPGHPEPDQAAQMMGLPSAEPLIYEGEVLEAIDSNSYTYIRVLINPQQDEWLAVPKQVVQSGQRIDYPEGVLMRDFYSKKHKRRFSQVRFVSVVKLSN
jgi:hypothetical protein